MRQPTGLCTGLFCLRSTYGAVVSASATVDALIRIDNVLAVLLADSLNRAALCTSTASDALVGCNFVCHVSIPPNFLI